jgi:hypothetical protein
LKPWIVKYLLDTAEQYGAQLYKVPVEQKGKKVQLVQVRKSITLPLLSW